MFSFVKRRIWFFVILAVIILVCLFSKTFFLSPQVCFGKNCLHVELARTSEERAKGLMFRAHLAQGRGMLFIFSEDGLWDFWMKNTYMPLDIIWLNKDKSVVDVLENAGPAQGSHPPVYKGVFPARYVLEANAGFVQNQGIKIGDKARFKWIFLSNKI